MTQNIAFQECVKQFKNGEIVTTRQINEEAQKILGKNTTMRASDFAEPETSKKRSKNNPKLFERISKGVYIL